MRVLRITTPHFIKPLKVDTSQSYSCFWTRVQTAAPSTEYKPSLKLLLLTTNDGRCADTYDVRACAERRERIRHRQRA